ncbi:C factor cell-cell signaling protein [Macrolepiota fuliginosa MF-IS2]|uniref:C factor cell-cell signaling protein n=1 Tax=Macrolepiota fuliginosa MF-IS2 TaxID=1400762 RepID=A0A9P6C3C4_9AGAR|nr:C factor cell-cell signaling protein [Macrolepiota fuliginosa MF-IS2]
MPSPFVLVTPGATRGLSLALTRQFLKTTNYPVFASHRTHRGDDEIKNLILDGIKNDVDPTRLNLLRLDLTSEDSIRQASDSLENTLSKGNWDNPYIHTAFVTGGVLFPEKQPADLDWAKLKETYQINVISHLLIIKHFSRFLPSASTNFNLAVPSKWVHITARLGSIADNHRGGWFSYRSSKTALDQVVKTFDLYLELHKSQSICVGVHPGTVKTDLSKGYWKSAAKQELFDPQDAAENLVNVVENLQTRQRGKIWDWAGEEIPW